MLYIAVLNNNKQIIHSNVPEYIHLESINSAETIVCDKTLKKRRQVRIKEDNYEIILVSVDPNITNRIFKHYVEALKLIIPIVFKTNLEITEREAKKTRRLKHNIISYTTKIQQELYKLIPQETVAKGASKQLSTIEHYISKNLRNSAYSYLKILKNINFMKSEFAAYDMLNKERGNHILDYQSHSIYKVIHLSLSSFWLDFIEKNIHINIAACNKSLLFDYNSLSVSLCHIFDNATKYACPNSEINIKFNEHLDQFLINISMVSLKINADEVNEIFSEDYSGTWANKIGLSGNGIGMYIIQKLLGLNKIKIELKLNTNTALNKTIENIPYEHNEFVLTFDIQ